MMDPEKLDEKSRNILNFLRRRRDVSVFCKDLNCNFFFGNRDFLHDCGLDSLTLLIGKSDYDLLWTKEESAGFRLLDKEIMDKNVTKVIVEEQSDFRNKKRWIETTKVPLIHSNGKTAGLIGWYFEKEYSLNSLNSF